jgi:hypothetical protein
MKMIARQAGGVNLPFGLGASLGQGGEEHPAVALGAKDGPAAIPPVHHGKSLRQTRDTSDAA